MQRSPEVGAMSKFLKPVERFLLVVGALFILVCLLISLGRLVLSRVALFQFDSALAAKKAPSALHDEADFNVWNATRLLAYRNSLLTWAVPPLAVLTIEKVHLRVPVFEGTDEAVLNRGAGHISGTAKTGEEGNIGIAGHRDGFFRSLEDIAIGDRIEVTTSDGTRSAFLVDEILIVQPKDIYVLRPRVHPSVTLVTCYPFYFVGSAPQRYIVRASVVDAIPSMNIKFRSGKDESRTPGG